MSDDEDAGLDYEFIIRKQRKWIHYETYK